MKKFLLLCTALILSVIAVRAQQFALSGYVQDDETGEPLLGASVYVPGLKKGTLTDQNGYYSLVLPAGNHQVVFSQEGFYAENLTIYLGKNEVRIVRLKEDYYFNDTEDNDGYDSLMRDESVSPSPQQIDIPRIQKMPSFFGEVDVVKGMQYLPGVQIGLEGAGGLYVRGGTPDQNLVMLDGVPIYNVNHAFGFFSSFQPDAVSSARLYKGGFPARFGSRLSSVVDLTMKDGNTNEFHGAAGLGLLSFYGFLEGPLSSSGKTSFTAAFRRTVPGILNVLNPLATFDDNEESGADFYDITAKVTHRVSPTDKISFSFYRGKDDYFAKITEQSSSGSTRIEEINEDRLDWTNMTGAINWQHITNNKTHAQYSLAYTEYLFNIRSNFNQTIQSDTGKSETAYLLRYYSGVRDFIAKADYQTTYSFKHHFRYGAWYILHAYAPGSLEADLTGGSLLLDTTLGPNRRVLGNEIAAYFEDEIRLGDQAGLNAGLRMTVFMVDGRSYLAPEPRLAFRYAINPKTNFKASYAYMTQYQHMVSNSGLGLPTDLWFPSTGNIKPQQNQQITAGLVRSVRDNWEMGVEGYYKWMNNVLDFAEGADYLIAQIDWEKQVEQGIGRAYGVEFFVQKKYGVYTGLLSYTLAWNKRQFENINHGEWYYFRYDRRHQVNMTFNVPVTQRSALSFTAVYGTGYPITFPYGRYLD
ncbi:MAG: TonB-dependent receptor, partial [Bacteroidota bacterium]|nr:TonB-dependent receptor [Bacteroidota bacterium]MDX5429755.1 TonB-dependent receptor [Bacteroidota bacterium]MDX5468534.1 TonB-dependent receptor [Bacteroidota bacterium]